MSADHRIFFLSWILGSKLGTHTCKVSALPLSYIPKLSTIFLRNIFTAHMELVFLNYNLKDFKEKLEKQLCKKGDMKPGEECNIKEV